MNYSVSKNRDGIFWSIIFRDRRNRDGKFPSLFPSLFSIRDGIPSLFFNFLVVFLPVNCWSCTGVCSFLPEQFDSTSAYWNNSRKD